MNYLYHVLIFSLFLVSTTSKLVQLHVLFRHGDRNIISTYPADPYKEEKYWPEGFGQLTNRGKEQHYLLGQWIRKKYDHFLNKYYSVYDLYVRSTDVDRTLMSVQTNLLGVYPPTENETWNKAVAWQPIPVHTVPADEDMLLKLEATCPQADIEMNNVLNSEKIQAILEEHKELLQYLSDNSEDKIKTIRDVAYLYDSLYIEKSRNLTLPSWTDKIYPEKIKAISEYSFAITSFSDKLRRLRGGPLLSDIIQKMEAVKTKKDTKQMYMYSAHDTTVSMFLCTLGVFDLQIPCYAMAVMVELHEESGKYFVQVAVKNDTYGNEDHILTIPGCKPKCPLSDFEKLLHNYIPEDVERECTVSETLNPFMLSGDITILKAGAFVTAGVLGGVLIIAIIAGIVCWRRRNQQNPRSEYRYRTLNDSGL